MGKCLQGLGGTLVAGLLEAHRINLSVQQKVTLATCQQRDEGWRHADGTALEVTTGFNFLSKLSLWTLRSPNLPYGNAVNV